MRGEIRIVADEPAPTADRYIRLLAEELRELRPLSLETLECRLTLRNHIFHLIFSWNHYLKITSATVLATPASDTVLVSYDIGLLPLMLYCAAGTVFILVATASSGIDLTLGAVAMVWIWLFGANVVLMRWQFVKLLRRIASKVVGGEVDGSQVW